ncbi:MAG TPA: acyl carrier protein, partial [Candidatus Hydrogenedentes bacterium]|nr:acyl carrier protein [Candidatus Hydrogenedentota bacterium]
MSLDQNIVEVVNSHLVEEFELEPESLHPDAHLVDDLGMDSLDLVDMVLVLQNAFGVKLR